MQPPEPEDENDITEEMIQKAEKDQKIAEKKKRKLEEIEKKKKQQFEPDDYDNYGKNKLESQNVKN